MVVCESRYIGRVPTYYTVYLILSIYGRVADPVEFSPDPDPPYK